MTDPRNQARHRSAVVARAADSPSRFVMPADWRERRALLRMSARGEAAPVLGFPGLWTIPDTVAS